MACAYKRCLIAEAPVSDERHWESFWVERYGVVIGRVYGLRGVFTKEGNGFTLFIMDSYGIESRSFKLKDFEGPLDLLLFLIKKNEINIYDIPVAQITEQYLVYVSGATALDLDDVTEFQAMAANLLYIKSRMLLPMELNLANEHEDPRQELVEKLIEYQKFKKLSELMEEKERQVEWVVDRKKVQRDLPFAIGELWSKADVWDLFETFSSLMTNISSERIIDLYEEVSINEKQALIVELLEARGECRLSDLVVRKGSLMDIICAFLAILESVKIRMILITQDRMFGDITIRPHEHFYENLVIHGEEGADSNDVRA